MRFFHKRKKEKQHRLVRFSDVDSIVMETEGMHFELLPREYVVKYRNVISSKNGGMSFPNGYFDEHKSHIPHNTMDLISTTFEHWFTNLIPENHLDDLPFGAARDAYMMISSLGNKVYYTNTHAINDGFQVKKEPIAEEFKRIVHLLMSVCSFPILNHSEIRVKQSSALLDKTNAKPKSDNNKRLIGYRFSATGVFGYTYCTTSGIVCSVSTVFVPSAPVMIHGNDVTWRSDFAEEPTIIPGLSRSIIDESSGTQLFRIVFKDRGKYEINESIVVYCNTGNYTFYCDDKVIANIIRFNGKTDDIIKPADDYYDYEPYFEVTSNEEIDTELLMVLLAFPMLSFGF